jgi:hypothetical protein
LALSTYDLFPALVSASVVITAVLYLLSAWTARQVPPSPRADSGPSELPKAA